MSDTSNKKYLVLDDVIVFKKPKPGTSAYALVPAGTILEGKGSDRPHTSLTPWGEFTYTEVDWHGLSGYLLSLNLKEVEE